MCNIISRTSTTHPSYIQDKPDFIDEINKGPKLDENVMLVIMDATALYDNIPHKEVIECLGEALYERQNPKVPTGFIQRMMKVVLEWNLFMFHDATYLQKIAMGIHPAPNYLDIFMARKIDKNIWKLIDILKNIESANIVAQLIVFKRFLDDIFQTFRGTTKQIHQIYQGINFHSNHNESYIY